MPRPRTPTAVMLINGAAQKHPERVAARSNEPVVNEALGPPPPSLTKDERLAWIEIERLAPWLRSADRIAVEMTAALLAAFRTSDYVSPQHTLRLEAMLGRLGMTPADRSKVSVPPPPNRENPFSRMGVQNNPGRRRPNPEKP